MNHFCEFQVQRDTLSKNCATKQKVISAKEEELEGLNNIVEEMATQKVSINSHREGK